MPPVLLPAFLYILLIMYSEKFSMNFSFKTFLPLAALYLMEVPSLIHYNPIFGNAVVFSIF